MPRIQRTRSGSAVSWLVWAAVAGVLACGSTAEEAPMDDSTTTEAPVEAVSLLGQDLVRPDLDAETMARLEANLAAAEAELEASPDSADALIWVGRRTAYLGRYNDALEIFGRGVERFPEDARFLRHRGHRYLSVRRFEDAEADLAAAAEAMSGQPDQVEPDGIPNDRNQPTSTLQSNVWYHLGLARYVQGNYEGALEAYRECLAVSGNPDMLVATSYWLYLTLRRLERVDEAAEVLEPITADLDIIENRSYHELLLLFRGERSPGDLLGEDGEPLDLATQGYGLGTWYLVEGDEAAARREYEAVLEGSQWAAFGYLASEAEIARLRDLG